jgi:putative transposase
MAHQKHVHVPGGVYFVSAAGKGDQAIFADESDRASLSLLVARVITQCGAKVHAFTWLQEQLLMVLQVYGVSLSGVMQRIISQHARRVNAKLGHKGNLFQHPHRAILLEDSASVLEAIATVHRRPVSAWSSHHAYLGLDEVPWLTKGTILELLSETPELQVTAYAELINREEPRKPTVGLRPGEYSRKHVCRPHDQFLAWLKMRSAERARPASLDELIQAVAQWFQVDPAAIESTASSPLLSLARALIAWTAMQNGIASLSELGRRFARGRSTLHETREVYRVRAPKLFNIPLDQILKGPGVALSDVLCQIGAAHDEPCCPKK